MVISKSKPLSEKLELSKANKAQLVLVTASSMLVVGAIGYFASKKRVGVAVVSALVGGGIAFFVDARVQAMKRKMRPNT
jgi:uncharacterized membrane-anchored protein